MDLRQLRYFVAVAEELHFGRAAVRVGIAQPPLTQQIQKLERMLGCALFIRGRKTVLTEPGKVLLERARLLLEQAERAVAATQDAARGETGQLTVGVPPSVMLLKVTTAVRRYRERYPDVRFTLREMSTSAIEDAVRSGTIDLGFLREAQPQELASEIVLKEPIVAVVPKGSPKNQPFVLFPRRLGPAFYDRLLSAAERMQPARKPRAVTIVQEATQWQTIVSLVEAGMGISVAPGCVRKFKWPGVSYVPIAGAETTVSACWRGEQMSPTIDAFMRIVRATLR